MTCIRSKTCSRCRGEKPLTEFGRYKDRHQNNCKSCNKDVNDIRRLQRTAVLDRYKRMKGCAQCGYKDHPYALEFDHIDRSTKSFSIGSAKLKPWPVIKAEIAKCQVLCGNCHNIRSNKQKRGEL